MSHVLENATLGFCGWDIVAIVAIVLVAAVFVASIVINKNKKKELEEAK